MSSTCKVAPDGQERVSGSRPIKQSDLQIDNTTQPNYDARVQAQSVGKILSEKSSGGALFETTQGADPAFGALQKSSEKKF